MAIAKLPTFCSTATRAPPAKTAYIGKHGWNTFSLDGTIPPDEIQDLIDTSYQLVVAKLPKSKRPA